VKEAVQGRPDDQEKICARALQQRGRHGGGGLGPG